MTTVDWIVLALFAAAMFAIAVVSAIRTKAPEDYFTGGRRTRRFMLILFAFGSGTATDSQSSVMATTWRSGLSGLWWQFLWLPITPFYWIIAPLLRRLRAVTTADFFAMRFGTSTAALYAVYGVIISVVLMAGVLFSSARLLDTLTDPFFGQLSTQLNIRIPVIDMGVVLQPPAINRPPLVVWRLLGGEELIACGLSLMLMTYAVIGGLSSAIVIDAVQGVIRILLTLLLLPMIFHRIGGFGVLHTMDRLKPGMFDFVASSNATIQLHQEPFTPFYLCMLSVAALLGIIVQPHILTICGAGKTELDARIGFTFGNLLKRSMAVAWTLIGLACVAWYLGPSSPLQNADNTQQQSLLENLRTAASDNTPSGAEDELRSIQATDMAFADRIFGRVVRDLLGDLLPGLTGLIVSMVLAAAISHCGTQMIVASGLFADHLYRHYINPGRDPRHYLDIARLCGPILVVIALLLQTTFSDVTDALKLVIKTPAIIGISMWMGLFWTRWNTISVWSTTIAAAAVGILCGYYPEEVLRTFPGLSDVLFVRDAAGLSMIDAWKIVFILGSGLIAGVTATLLTDPQPDSQMEHFYRVIRSPVTPNENRYAAQFIPPEGDDLVPSISLLGFQLPGPTRAGTIGFVVAWIVVIGMVLLTKWLSMVV